MDAPAAHESREGVSFLTDLLVRYPEIGSASLCQGGRALRLDFYLHRRLEDEDETAFREQVDLHWDVFFQLQRLHPDLRAVQRSEARRGESLWRTEGDDPLEVDSLQVLRDLQTVTVEELAMLAAMVRDHFDQDLALNEEAVGEDTSHQDEMLHRSLEKVRSLSGEATLTGFRDDMRVLIYASQESE